MCDLFALLMVLLLCGHMELRYCMKLRSREVLGTNGVQIGDRVLQAGETFELKHGDVHSSEAAE